MTLTLVKDSEPELPNDGDIELLVGYVGRFMTDAEAEAFEARLVDDEEFFDRVSPMLDAWYTPGPTLTGVETARRMVKEGRLPATSHRQRWPVRLGLAAAAGIAVLM